MTDTIVGIDLGTSNTVVAHADAAGVPQVLGDANSFKIHPSVVSFHPSGGVVVGAAAKQRKVIDPKNTIFSVKRLIGRSFRSQEVQTARQRMPYQIKEGANQLPLIVTRGGEFAVPEISAIVLDHVRSVAGGALKTDVKRAVVTVPASFNDAQRSATATAGSIAGLEVVRVLNEPTAAALAYGNTRNLRETIAVYDFGGGTFDITILKLDDQVYEVLGTSGDTFLGGDDIDERLVDRMVEKFLAENRIDLRTNEVSMMRLRAVAEQTKIELSRRSRAMVRVDEIAYGSKGKPLDLQIEIRRDELVGQIGDIIDRTFPVCDESLKLAGLTIDHIDDVILVGGTTKIPYVRDQVAKFFAKAPRTDINPEDAVAVGAALQAAAFEARPQTSTSRARSAGMFDDLDSTFREQSGVTETEPFELGVTSLDPVPPTPNARTTAPYEGAASPRTTAPYEVATPPRTTAPYEGATSPRATAPHDASRSTTERPVMRGSHHDVFEERTPPPVPTGPVLGRLTKSNVKVNAKPATPSVKTAPRVPAQRLPAVPPASPQARTMVIDPEAKSAASDSSTRIADPLDGLSDFGDDLFDLDLAPSSTAPGFSPAPAAAPPSPQTAPPSPQTAPPSPQTAPPSPQTAPPSPQIAPRSPQTAPLPPQTFPVIAPRAPVILEVTPRGLGIATVAGFCEELIRRNSRVPTEMRKLFTTSRDDQASVRIIVVQGESRRMDSNTVIAELRLDNLPRRPRGETSIEVSFMIDANGILQVHARDAQTGAEQRASLDIVGTIPQQDVSASRDKLQALRR